MVLLRSLSSGIVRILFPSQVVWFPAHVISPPAAEVFWTNHQFQFLVYSYFQIRRGFKDFKVLEQIAFGMIPVLTSHPSSGS